MIFGKAIYLCRLFWLMQLIFVVVCSSLFVFASESFAAVPGNFLPGSVEPGVLSKSLSASPITPPSIKPAPITRPEEQASNLGPQAEKIKFQLNKVILEENHVYSERELSKLYRNKIGKKISVAELQGIVQDITNYYRNNGYILTRAVLPPQHVANGVVHIRIVEGFIANIRIQGEPKKSRCILEKLTKNIIRSRPLQVKVLEHYLRLANEIPGLSVRSVLEPSKTEIGGSDMTLVATQKTIDAYASYDNYGTRYIGPQQVTGSVSVNSFFQSGDSTHLTTVRTAKPYELNYVDLSHEFPIGCKGMRGSVGANRSRTFPKYVLTPLKIDGDAVNFYGIVSYPVIRSRDRDFTLNGGVNYVDSGSRAFSAIIYNDHLRSANVGFNYNSSDSYKGANLLSGNLEHGFLILGASSNPNSLHVSRAGADGHFTKFSGNIGRLQQLPKIFSLFIYASGQYSWNPLLATEQFAYGGSQLGRGYDPAEIIGDRGLGGSAELRASVTPGWAYLQSLQPYMFYDAGAIWNIRRIVGVPQKLSATSFGLGTRFNFTKNLSGNLMIAQPLTKEVAALEIIGRGRKPRGFFSFVASI